MKYRKLGNTGLIVSEVALGTMQFGGKMNMGNLGQEDTTRMVKLALDRGINFIDTADVYSLGESETLVGNALKGLRAEIVLATKVRLPMSDNLNRSGATRVNIMREVEGSLKRLQTDYIDLSTRCMDGTVTRRSRRRCGRSTMSYARGRSAISASPISCRGRRLPR
jgi:aryl-alcohol dehydrogenase-like predicted oxidoreductase